MPDYTIETTYHLPVFPIAPIAPRRAMPHVARQLRTTIGMMPGMTTKPQARLM